MANNLGAIICRAKVIGFRAIPNNSLFQPKSAISSRLFAQVLNSIFAGFDFLIYEKTLGLCTNAIA
jgi:hypothetical protein